MYLRRCICKSSGTISIIRIRGHPDKLYKSLLLLSRDSHQQRILSSRDDQHSDYEDGEGDCDSDGGKHGDVSDDGDDDAHGEDDGDKLSNFSPSAKDNQRDSKGFFPLFTQSFVSPPFPWDEIKDCKYGPHICVRWGG